MGYYSIAVREQATKLREKGYSLKEIAGLLHIAKSTASTWVRNIQLSLQAQNRLQQRHILKQYRSSLRFKEKREEEYKLNQEIALKHIAKIKPTKETYKLICSLVFWCEGTKNLSNVRFTNSDPKLIQFFLLTLRKGFEIDESKLRILMHLHKYHDEEKQKIFWSEITSIPLSQFLKTYSKPNTGKNTHPNYPGCIAVYYYSAKVAKELHALYNCITDRGVVQW